MMQMFGRLSELEVLAQPKSTKPILSVSLVIIFVFIKLRAARKTESMLLVESQSSVGLPLKSFC